MHNAGSFGAVPSGASRRVIAPLQSCICSGTGLKFQHRDQQGHNRTVPARDPCSAMAPNDEKPSAASPPSVAPPPPPPDHGGKPPVYETFPGSKPGDRNGTAPAAPAPQPGHKRPTISEAAQTIKIDDWAKIHMIPCAREGFMTGIAAGFLVGGGRFVAGCEWPGLYTPLICESPRPMLYNSRNVSPC